MENKRGELHNSLDKIAKVEVEEAYDASDIFVDGALDTEGGSIQEVGFQEDLSDVADKWDNIMEVIGSFDFSPDEQEKVKIALAKEGITISDFTTWTSYANDLKLWTEKVSNTAENVLGRSIEKRVNNMDERIKEQKIQDIVNIAILQSNSVLNKGNIKEIVEILKRSDFIDMELGDQMKMVTSIVLGLSKKETA